MNLKLFLTATTESLAATVTMSAHDTTPGHIFSNWDLMVSITSNPLSELLFGKAVFSPVKFAVSSKRTDASHPYYKKLLKLVIFLMLNIPVIYIFHIHYKENVKVTINFTIKNKKNPYNMIVTKYMIDVI